MSSFCKSLKTGLMLGALMLFSVFTTESAQAQFLAGAGLAFGSGVEAIGLQGSGVFPLNEEQGIRIAGDFIIFFPGDTAGFDQSLFTINGNGHYIFSTSETLMAYALAGLHIGIYEADIGVDLLGLGSVSDTAVGLNAGAGVEYATSPGYLYGEAKIVLGGYSDFVISGGFRFPLGGNN